MKKRILSLLLAVLCGALTALPAAAAETIAAPVLLVGALGKTEDGLLTVDDMTRGEVILHTDETTRICAAVTGAAVLETSLRMGATVYVYASPAMTASLPPQTAAELILTEIPADYSVPEYATVLSVETLNEDGITVLTDRGVQTVPATAVVTPYRTKNLVTYRDLIPGTKCLLWEDAAKKTVERAVLFPYDGLPFTDVPADSWAADAISYVTARGILGGDEHLAFAPSNSLTRAQLVQALYAMAGSPAVAQYLPKFTDVQSGGDYLDALTWAVGNKLVGGYSDNTFRPNAAVDRQQLAVFLYRWEQHQGGGFHGAWMFLVDCTDRDDISEYAYEAVAWCSMNHILTGRTDGTLAPKAPVSRAAAAAMLQRYMTLTPQ